MACVRCPDYGRHVKPQRFELALERIESSQWREFEKLAAIFLASQYPNLRVLASESGDRGRDAILWQPEDDPTVVLQFSVTGSWQDKIAETASRLHDQFPGTQILTYVSPHVIGPAADSVSGSVRRRYGLYVDVRDRTFFLSRVNSDAATVAAAEELAERIVDPYLGSKGVIDAKPQRLSGHETQAAVVYLAMQLEDDVQEKGLTKLCFDGLVRAILRDTSPVSRMPRSEIHLRIRTVIPAHDYGQVDGYVDAALTRLEKRYLRHYRVIDEFCLTNDERIRIAERLGELELLDIELRRQLEQELRQAGIILKVALPDDLDELVSRARRVLECILVDRGEAFVKALETGVLRIFTRDEVREAATDDITRHPEVSKLKGQTVPIVAHAVESALVDPSPDVLTYLHLLANSYTLFSLVRATPNVQSSIVKLFSDGEIWLDTTAVLPLLAETLVEEDDRRFTVLLRAARSAGISFYITPGVLEEIEAHTYRCLVYTSAHGEWRSRIPFLYSAYVSSGNVPAGFRKWMETFRGTTRPADDIEEFLSEELKIRVRSLESEASQVSDEIRVAVGEVWNEIQDRRRSRSEGDLDPVMAMKLARHDAESYLGVIHRRGSSMDSPFGYRAWWLTLDHAAYRVHEVAQQRTSTPMPSPPTLSPDFLSQYLSIGAIRRQLDKGTEHSLPLMLDVGALDVVSSELLDVADRVRADLDGLPERVVRRRIRDAMDGERLKRGPIAEKGLGVVEEDLVGVKEPRRA